MSSVVDHSTEENEMNICSVPAEVVDCYVLPYLEWNDLLRFRRVCKWTKAIVDGYLKVHPELAPEIEIDEEEKSFAAFLEMGIPTIRIFFSNTSGDQFYEDAGEDGVNFLMTFGKLVKHLRVDQLSLLVMGEERKFLDGLKNMEGLEAYRYGGYKRGLSPAEAQECFLMKVSLAQKDQIVFRDKTFVLPEFIQGLKTLKIGNYDNGLVVRDPQKHSGYFLSKGGNLESVAMPFSPAATPGPESPLYALRDSPLGIHFGMLLSLILKRRQQNPPLTSLKEIDFVSYHYRVENLLTQFIIDWTASPYFLGLSNRCVSPLVKFWDVAAAWFMAEKFMIDPEVQFANLGIPVFSLLEMHPCVLSVNMPNLEKIEITLTSCSSPGPDWRNERPNWSSLKDLRITVDSRQSNYFDMNRQNNEPVMYSTRTMELFSFFFEDVSRTAMTELRFCFLEGVGTVAIPNTEHIVAACPNLKKLMLINWPGTNKALTKLWSGLLGLEEVSLVNCVGLGNVAFVGEDVRSPVFLKLKKLKKLCLQGLDTMPKITDTSFSLVIRHLELTHLILISTAPVKSVTGNGVRLLLDGKFAGAIEKFPFEDWSLDSLSAEEFQWLGAMFRSSSMI